MSALFAADPLLASQLLDLRKPARSSQPLCKLMLAVLADALDCFVEFYGAHPLSRRGRLSSEARRWLFDDAGDFPFSFEWVCDGLGLSASYFRSGIRRIEARMAAQNDHLKRI